MKLDETEIKFCRELVTLSDSDPEGAFGGIYASLDNIVPWPANNKILRNLKKRGIIDGDGDRGKFPSFWATDKTRETLEQQETT